MPKSRLDAIAPFVRELLRFHSYPTVKAELKSELGLDVSVRTIRRWAKKHGLAPRAAQDDDLASQIDAAQATKANELVEQARIDLPEDPIEFVDRFVWFEHVETHEPVRGLRAYHIDYLENRTVCRYDSAGNRIGGRDMVGKFRRGAFSSVFLVLMMYSLMRDKGLVGRTFMQLGKDEVLEPLHKIIRFVLAEWGRRDLGHWARGWRKVGNFWRHENQSEYAMLTAGVGEETAKKQARGSGIDFAHLSEIGYYSKCRQLLAAVLKAVPLATGSVAAESTFDFDREHPFPREYRATKEGRGRFLKAFFYEWFRDPLKRYPRESEYYAQVMRPDFEVSKADLEIEKRLVDEHGITDEQIAFRRYEYLLGDPEDRRAARRENPEDDETIFEHGGETWLDVRSLDAVDSSVQAPLKRRRLGPLFSVSIWNERPTALVVGIDNATRDGRDYKAAVFIDPVERAQVAEIHGRATDHQMAVAIYDVVDELVGLNRSKYVLAPERNRAKELILELMILRLRIYESPGGAAGKGRGVLSTGTSRGAILAGIADAIEGPDHHDNGEPRSPEPTWSIRSKFLAAELRGIRVGGDGKVRGYPHDDLSIGGLGTALYVAPRVKFRLNTRAAVWVPESSGRAAIKMPR